MCVSFWFLVIFSHVNQWQSVKWANKYKILILNSHFRLRKLRLSYQGTKNVAIYAFSSGKILDVRKIAGVKNMTNIMSGKILWFWTLIFHSRGRIKPSGMKNNDIMCTRNWKQNQADPFLAQNIAFFGKYLYVANVDDIFIRIFRICA